MTSAPIDMRAAATMLARHPVHIAIPEIGGHLGAAFSTIDVWLWDHQRRALRSITRVDSDPVPLDELARWLDGRGAAPIVVHGVHLGFLSVDEPGADPDDLGVLADMVGPAVRASIFASDATVTATRSRTMALPAELQWSLLPPDAFEHAGIKLTAGIEPAYETGGDVYDYAERSGVLSLAVLDARGHGLEAATTSAVATAAMRRARRAGDDLDDIADAIATAVASIVGSESNFVSAVLVELDVTSGTGSWLSAGHLPPIVFDEEGAVRELELRPTLPLGLAIDGERSDPVTQPLALERGDRLVLYSDGIVDNVTRSGGQRTDGVDQFHDALRREAGRSDVPGHHTARAVIEDLLHRSGPELYDDATLLVVHRQT